MAETVVYGPTTPTLDEKLRLGCDSTSVNSVTSQATITARLASVASRISEAFISKATGKENDRPSSAPTVPALDSQYLSEKLQTVKEAQETAAPQQTGIPTTVSDHPVSLGSSKQLSPRPYTTQRSISTPTDRYLPRPHTPQRSISGSMTSLTTLRQGAASRASFCSTRSFSTSSSHFPQIYSAAVRQTAKSPGSPGSLHVNRQSRYLAHHASVQSCLYYTPFPHRSVSLPPLLEGDLITTSASIYGDDTNSIRSGVSTISHASRVSSLGLQMNGPDHKGWSKVVADYQIREVITNPTPQISRQNSLTAASENWQMDGTLDGGSEKGFGIQSKMDRRFRSSDSDRVTRGSSEVVRRDSVSDCQMTAEDEEKGKEEEWERRRPIECREEGKDEAPWKLVFKQTWERARCWLGFRLLSW